MADGCNPAERFYRLIQLREELDRLASRLLNRNPGAFGVVSQLTPRLTPPELGFLRSIAYLYVLYFEVGRVAIRFLGALLDTYHLDGDSVARNHFQEVDRLRTYLQHNLDSNKAADRQTLEQCEMWIKRRCGTALPSQDGEWQACLCGLLEDACISLERVVNCVRAIEQDESKDVILGQWAFELDRHHSPEQFDPIVAAAAADMGAPFLDVQRFRQRHYERWMARLRTLAGKYEFSYEARRLAEEAMLADATAMMPLTGGDIIEFLGIAPGPAVRTALETAWDLFRAAPCDRERLLERVRERMSPPNSQEK